MFLNSEVSYLISRQQSTFSFTEDKTKDGKTHKQVASEGGCSGGLAKHLHTGNSEYGDRHQQQTLDSHLFLFFILVCPIILFKIEVLC